MFPDDKDLLREAVKREIEKQLRGNPTIAFMRVVTLDVAKRKGTYEAHVGGKTVISTFEFDLNEDDVILKTANSAYYDAFRSALTFEHDGKICCSTDDPKLLCARCKAAYKELSQQGINVMSAASRSPFEDPSYKPHGAPPDGYQIALRAASRGREVRRDANGIPDPYATALARRASMGGWQ